MLLLLLLLVVVVVVRMMRMVVLVLVLAMVHGGQGSRWDGRYSPRCDLHDLGYHNSAEAGEHVAPNIWFGVALFNEQQGCFPGPAYGRMGEWLNGVSSILYPLSSILYPLYYNSSGVTFLLPPGLRLSARYYRQSV